jgi:hypothetical protein
MDDFEFRAASMDIRAAMTLTELMQVGLTADEARREMDRRCYGSDVEYDRHGAPIEKGIGSPWSIRRHPEKNRNHFLNILQHEGPDAHARALAAAGLKQAP